MHTKPSNFSLLILVLAIVFIAFPAWSEEVVSISITSTHSGFTGFSGKSFFKISKTSKGYKGTLEIINPHMNLETLVKEGIYIKESEDSWKLNTKVSTAEKAFHRLRNDISETFHYSISNEQIEYLLKTLNAPPKTSLEFSQFGIYQKWLRDMATKATDKWLDSTQDYYFLLKSRQLKLINTLSSEAKAHYDLSMYYSGLPHSDDYPELEAIITLSDNKTIHLESDSQKEFMIPWKVKSNGQEFTTYDLQISKTLNNLLPEKFLEKERIQGDLSRVFEEYLWSDEIHGWLNTAESEFQLRGQIDFIKNEFIVVEGRLTSEYNKDGWKLIDKGEWEVTLSHKKWPKNLLVYTKIPYLSGRIERENFSTDKIHFYIKKLTKLGWLFKYIQKHPDVQFIVNFSQDRSITSLDFNEKMERLIRNQNYEWKSEKLPYHEDIILLSVYKIRGGSKLRSSLWLIFPDKTATLHHFHGERVLNWSSQKLSRWKKYNTYYSGARISPDGKIMRPN